MGRREGSNGTLAEVEQTEQAMSSTKYKKKPRKCRVNKITTLIQGAIVKSARRFSHFTFAASCKTAPHTKLSNYQRLTMWHYFYFSIPVGCLKLKWLYMRTYVCLACFSPVPISNVLFLLALYLYIRAFFNSSPLWPPASLFFRRPDISNVCEFAKVNMLRLLNWVILFCVLNLKPQFAPPTMTWPLW